MKLEKRKVEDLIPYENNAKLHPRYQIEEIKESIKQFGFCDPIGISKDNIIIEGHGRWQALKELGIKECEVIVLDHLTDEERRAYTLVHNKTCTDSSYDYDLMDEELTKIEEIDMSKFNFNLDNNHFWDIEGETNEEYEQFVNKFNEKPPLTTDDCYTPNEVYEAVKNWAIERYGLQGRKIIRPFYPGGDYQKETYPKGCVVIDNPPFSILSEICRWYNEKGIDYFLFAPSLTFFSTAGGALNYVVASPDIIYENGAKVPTDFVTNLGDIKVELAYDLKKGVEDAQDAPSENARNRYEYPINLITSALLKKYLDKKVSAKIKNAYFVRKLDCQESGSVVFGGGFIISESKAKEIINKQVFDDGRIVFKFSDREQRIAQELEEKDRA